MVAHIPEPTAGASDALDPYVAAVAGVSLAGIRVLVVDDDSTARELNREILLQSGGEVRACTSGDEALDVLRQWRPDVMVSDIEMPGMDGYSLIRQVRMLDPDQGGKTPAIALSAYGRPEDRVRSLIAGFNFHVSKPVEPSELTAIVASLAGRVG
jgi:CheY-like chemotaxis protein